MLLMQIMRFYAALLWFYLLPDVLRDQRPDANHCHRRRFTKRYLAKKRIVRNLWLGVLSLTLLCNLLAFIPAVAMIISFVSFTILDETR